jgi:hypothetical protein
MKQPAAIDLNQQHQIIANWKPKKTKQNKAEWKR